MCHPLSATFSVMACWLYVSLFLCEYSTTSSLDDGAVSFTTSPAQEVAVLPMVAAMAAIRRDFDRQGPLNVGMQTRGAVRFFLPVNFVKD